MKISSSRASLARARMIRQARRDGRAKTLSSRNSSTAKTNSLRNTSAANRTQTAKSEKIALYETIEKSAAKLQKYSDSMLAFADKKVESESTIETTIDNTETTESSTTTAQTGQKEKYKEELIEYIEDFVDRYNDMYEALGDTGSTVNKLYVAKLDEAFSTYKKELSNLGITQAKDGTLSLSSKQLEAAEYESLVEVFSDKKGFVTKVSEYSENIEKSAESTIGVLNKMYGSTSSYNRYGSASSYYGSSGSWYNSLG